MTSQAFRENYALIEWKPFPKRRRQDIAPARSDLPTPMLIRDALDEPLQSQANGKWYETKSGLRASYLPSGNPDGIRYVEVGNDPARLKPFQRPKRDPKTVRDAVDRAFARHGRGERVK